MSAKFVSCCLLLVVAFLSASASAKDSRVRQVGGACGEDSSIKATCDVGLYCKEGTCAMESFLSSQVIECRQALGTSGIVAVLDGFCYINSRCPDLYAAADKAEHATLAILSAGAKGPEAYAAELAKLSDSEKALFEKAQGICKSCAPNCVVGLGYHQGTNTGMPPRLHRP